MISFSLFNELKHIYIYTFTLYSSLFPRLVQSSLWPAIWTPQIQQKTFSCQYFGRQSGFVHCLLFWKNGWAYVKKNSCQVIPFVTFWSPNVGLVTVPLKGSRELTIPKRSQSQNCQLKIRVKKTIHQPGINQWHPMATRWAFRHHLYMYGAPRF